MIFFQTSLFMKNNSLKVTHCDNKIIFVVFVWNFAQKKAIEGFFVDLK
jgi:hypothetical protein